MGKKKKGLRKRSEVRGHSTGDRRPAGCQRWWRASSAAPGASPGGCTELRDPPIVERIVEPVPRSECVLGGRRSRNLAGPRRAPVAVPGGGSLRPEGLGGPSEVRGGTRSRQGLGAAHSHFDPRQLFVFLFFLSYSSFLLVFLALLLSSLLFGGSTLASLRSHFGSALCPYCRSYLSPFLPPSGFGRAKLPKGGKERAMKLQQIVIQ